VDFLTLVSELEHRSQLQEVGGAAYLSSLINATPTSVHALAYARQVKDAAVRRRVIRYAGDAAGLACDPSLPLQDVLARVEAGAFKLREGLRAGDALRPLAEAVTEVQANLEAVIAGKTAQLLTTGFSELDKLIGGWRRGSLNIVGARPAKGKSALLLGFAAYAARQKQTALIFSLEMTGAEIVGRLAVAGTGVNLFQLTTSQALQGQWPAVTSALSDLTGEPIWLDDTGGIALPELRAKALRLATRAPLGLIIVDYVQLVTLGQHSEKRYQELGAISRGLKALAKELPVPIIVAAQLSRAVEQRSDHRPALADLRESGDLEQEADTVLLIDRPEQDEDYALAELIVAKNRHGPAGTVPLLWRRARASFVAVTKP
jgi:replicative DNA helicase